jgi:hypothetical protein
MGDQPIALDRASVIDAVADYILQVNHRGYRPDRNKVLAVRKAERTASLRDVATPVRNEAFYFIEGETARTLAERLVAGVWENLWVWNAYDFTRSTSGMNR